MKEIRMIQIPKVQKFYTEEEVLALIEERDRLVFENRELRTKLLTANTEIINYYRRATGSNLTIA